MSPVHLLVRPPGGGGGSGQGGVTDTFTVRPRLADTNTVPADVLTYGFNAAYADPNAGQNDTARLSLAGYNDASGVPTDTRRATLTWTQGATTASQTGNWTNPANAQGTANATNATLTDAVTNSNAGTLSLSAYPDAPTDLQTWTVTSARLRSYHAITGWTGVDNNLVVAYDVGGGFQTMWTITANENFASTPRDFTLPTLTWAQIDAMQVRFVYTAGLLANAATINVDAVHLEVTATKDPL